MRVERAFIECLERVVGENNVIIEREQLEDYLVDETAEPVRPQPAVDVILVKPADASEVSMVLELANENKIPVFPRGGGTGLVGGAIPVSSGLILSMERMNRIEIDKDNLMAVAEAGVRLEKLIKEADDGGLSFPLLPGDESAQVGGLVATNAGGSKAVKYGIIRDYVKGVEVVLPTGKMIELGGKLIKNNTGYNLLHLIIGSEGTLGVITKATLRLRPKVGASATLIAPYDTRHDCVNTVPEILRSGVTPLAIEYVEKELMELSAKQLGESWRVREGEVYLYMIMEESNQDQVFSESEKIEKICKENGSFEVLFVESRDEQDRIMKTRSNIYLTLKPDTADILDVVVPPANIGILADEIDNIAEKHQIRIPLYGHVGDGNIHPHIMKEGTPWCPHKGRDLEYVEEVKNEIYRASINLGGLITGEHGIGKIRINDLNVCLNKKILYLMREIKNVFDPNNILNPGKVIIPK